MTKTTARKILTMGNHKLGSKIATWSLPVSKSVCGRVCEGCYALKAQRQYPAVLPSREKKLAMSKKDNFKDLMIKAINTLQPEYVRVHDSGEFYSQKYVDDWSKIAEQLPKFKFYAYTKRLNDFDFTKLKSQSNFVVIDSLHGGKINFGPKEKYPDGMFLCPDHKGSKERVEQPKGSICGTLCNYCMTKDAERTSVYFVAH